MITSNLVGGLGNYLFQIAATYSLSLDNNDKMVYNINDVSIVHGHINTYLDNIFRNINFTEENLPIGNVYDEPYFNFTEITYSLNLKLNGYYQSEKYFKHNEDKIRQLFFIDDKTNDYLIKKYDNYLTQNNTCSLHVRRGDYLRLPNHHPVCDISYYKESVDVIGTDKTYLIFSNDIEWCKINLDFITKKIFIEGNSDYQDLYLMSKCDNNIIANSSFSWWGAWLNNNPNKKVIAPKKWFGRAINHDIKDLIPNTWITL